jgi:hypothetical protein
MHWGPIGPQKRRYHNLSAHPQANGKGMARTCVACMLILDRCGIVNGQYRGQEAVCVAEPPRHWAICRHVRPFEACTLNARQTSWAVRLRET